MNDGGVRRMLVIEPDSVAILAVSHRGSVSPEALGIGLLFTLCRRES
jgi:hypothetical protein